MMKYKCLNYSRPQPSSLTITPGACIYRAGSSTSEHGRTFAITKVVGDLEKWIEADIQQGGVAQGGFCATWWLEMGPSEPSGLILEGFLYVNPDGCDISLPIKTAETLSELKQGIATLVNELQTALDINQEFIQAIESARSQTNK